MAAELILEACTRGTALGPHEALDGSAMLEEAGRSTGVARVSRGGDFHAACIGAPRPSGNPWRE